MKDSEKLDLILDQMGTVNERLEGIDGRLDGMDKRFDEVDRRFEAVDKRLDGIDKRLDGMDKRFNGMDEKLKVVDKRLDGMDEKLKVVDKRLDTLEENDRALDVRLDVFAEELSDYGRKLRETSVFMENVLNRDIRFLSENHMSLLGKIQQAATVSEKANFHDIQMSLLKARVEKLETEVGDIKLKRA